MTQRQTRSKALEPVVLEKLLTIKDVANLLQLSTVRIYHYMRFEGLPSIKVCGSRRVRPSELQMWIDQQNAS